MPVYLTNATHTALRQYVVNNRPAVKVQDVAEEIISNFLKLKKVAGK